MASAAFVDHCLELLASLGQPRARRMFGGHGLYVDEVFVALVVADRLYLKVDAQTQPVFAAAGCQPFVYEARGRPVTLSYWTAPDEAMEAPALMLPWARLALQAALRTRQDAAPRRQPKRAAVKARAAKASAKAPRKTAARRAR